jgi:F0F1-type ATP synthase membrane subunit c/vacuolar-type H+-ATPase subunit K
VLVLVGVAIAVVAFDGASTLVVCGVAVSLSYLLQAVVVDRAVRRDLPRASSNGWHSLARHFLVSVLTIAPAAFLGRLVAHVGASRVMTLAGVAGGILAGVVAYIGVQSIMRSPEVASLRRTSEPAGPLTPIAEGGAVR